MYATYINDKIDEDIYNATIYYANVAITSSLQTGCLQGLSVHQWGR